MKTQQAAIEPLAWPLTVFRTQVCPMSRSTANNEIQSGELKTFLLKGRRMVLAAEGRAYVKRKAAAGGAVAPEVSEQKRAAGLKGRAAQLALLKATP